MPFYGPEACDFGIETSSAVSEGEKTTEVEDMTYWERSWDIDGVRRFVSVNLPTFDGGKNDRRVEELYNDLMESMGAEGAIRKITWPVVLILASKV